MDISQGAVKSKSTSNSPHEVSLGISPTMPAGWSCCSRYNFHQCDDVFHRLKEIFKIFPKSQLNLALGTETQSTKHANKLISTSSIIYALCHLGHTQKLNTNKQKLRELPFTRALESLSVLSYLIIVAVSVNFSGRCKFFQI